MQLFLPVFYEFDSSLNIIFNLNLEMIISQSVRLSCICSHIIFTFIIFLYNSFNRIMFLQKKLTLSSPYNKITKTLWEKKRNNASKEKENLILRTKVQKLTTPYQKDVHATLSKQLENRFQLLLEKSKEQESWIKSISQDIEERKYQQLKQNVKKVEIRLNKMTHRALKFEKILKKSYCHSKKSNFSKGQSGEKHQIKQHELERLQQQKAELQNFLFKKEQQLLATQKQNKQFNQTLLQLLKIKNLLRQQAKNSQESQKNQQLTSSNCSNMAMKIFQSIKCKQI